MRERGGRIYFQYPFNKAINHDIKTIRGYRFHAESKTWSVPASAPPGQIKAVLKKHGFSVPSNLKDKLNIGAPQVTSNVAASMARSADISVDGLGLDLFPFQRAAIAYAIDRRRLLISEPTGAGKAQPLDADVLTPNGWVSMGCISVGDKVIGRNGKPTTVVGVYPQGIKDVYELTFSDGSKAESCGEHLWPVRTKSQKHEGKGFLPRRLKDIKDDLYYRDGSKKWFIPVAEPVSFSQHEELPLPPYTLGALLGDGSLSSGNVRISCPDDAIVQRVSKELHSFFPESTLSLKQEAGSDIDYRITSDRGKPNELVNALKDIGLYGLKSHKRFIPKAYIFSSTEERTALLHGLLDTDGSANGRAATFSSASKQLTKDVQHIALSIGCTATYHEGDAFYIYKNERLRGRTRHRLYIAPKNDVELFFLGRKRASVKNPQNRTATRSISSVKRVGKKPCQCIQVANKDGLYITNDFVVTHNTAISIASVQALSGFPCTVVCPAALKLNWAKELLMWLPHLEGDISIVEGVKMEDMKPMHVLVNGEKKEVAVNSFSAKVLIINYTLLSIDVKKKGDAYHAGPIIARILGRGDKSVIMDEAHATKGDSLRSRACEIISEDIPNRFLLSATPIINGPQDLIRPLQIIDRLDEFGGWWDFTGRYCDRRETKWGIDISGAAHLDELHFKLRDTCYVRHDESLVKKDLPPKRRSYVPITVSSMKKYNGYLAETKKALKEEGNNTQKLAALAKLRSKLSELKLPAVMKWIDNFLESGEKLVVFAIHRSTQKALLTKYKDALRITADDSTEDRQRAVDEFQGGGHQLLICALGPSLTATPGAAGHTLTAACNVCFTELGWSAAHMDQAEDRLYRKGQERPVTAHYLIASDTFDEDVLSLIEKKRDVMNSATDGQDIVDDLKERLIKQKI